MTSTQKPSAYAASGVDIDKKMAGLDAIKKMVRATAIPGVLSGIGPFGGMFASPGREKILMATTDGVGTKLKVAVMAGRHDTVGQDLVNHCVNDILVHGAEPLFFLDYFGTSRLDNAVFRQVVAGFCKACRENGCALLGGETAELPALYPAGEYDLVGMLVGMVDRRRVVTGKDIRRGDVIIGLPSTGLHTNGYSLARRILFDRAKLSVHDRFPGARQSVADVLLAVHRSYLKPVKALMAGITVRGMAHITGGGFTDNVPRILPKNVTAVFDRSTWPVPHVFQYLQDKGRVDRDEMYRVFNMGIGLVIMVRPTDESAALRVLKAAKASPRVIGVVEKGDGKTRLIHCASS